MQMTSSSMAIIISDTAITMPIIVSKRAHSLNADADAFKSSTHLILLSFLFCLDIVKRTSTQQQHPCQGLNQRENRKIKAPNGERLLINHRWTEYHHLLLILQIVSHASTPPSAFAILSSIPTCRRKNISSRCFSRFLMPEPE